MNKELEALLNNLNCGDIVYVYKKYWNEIQKKLKALEIIKGSGFSLEFDESQNEWFLHISARGTGIKIHDLLKEVLKQ